MLGSRKAFDLVGLVTPSASASGQRGAFDELPPASLLNFLRADCWRYVRVLPARPGRRARVVSDEHTRRLSVAAAQEWAHPVDRGRERLRVALAGRCVPFLLADGPRRLSVGRVRVDALATTVLEGGTTRRARARNRPSDARHALPP